LLKNLPLYFTKVITSDFFGQTSSHFLQPIHFSGINTGFGAVKEAAKLFHDGLMKFATFAFLESLKPLRSYSEFSSNIPCSFH
jgi:hypothetical protein